MPAHISLWPFPAITYEVACYGLLLLAGLVLRLFMLGAWPLLESELSTVLAAWWALQGVHWHPDAYSPLLYDADLILFFFTRASDAAARLLPALAGAVLIAMPLFRSPAPGARGGDGGRGVAGLCAGLGSISLARLMAPS